MKRLNIEGLSDGMRKVDLTAKVTDIGDTREVKSRYSGETYRVADATLEDSTGSITLSLWNEDIDRVKIGDTVQVQNGYIKSFNGQLQLNAGKYGVLSVV